MLLTLNVPFDEPPSSSRSRPRLRPAPSSGLRRRADRVRELRVARGALVRREVRPRNDMSAVSAAPDDTASARRSSSSTTRSRSRPRSRWSREQRVGLLVFGADRKRLGRLSFRRSARRIRRDAGLPRLDERVGPGGRARRCRLGGTSLRIAREAARFARPPCGGLQDQVGALLADHHRRDVDVDADHRSGRPEASATRSRPTPRTRSSGSTTALRVVRGAHPAGARRMEGRVSGRPRVLHELVVVGHRPDRAAPRSRSTPRARAATRSGAPA